MGIAQDRQEARLWLQAEFDSYIEYHFSPKAKEKLAAGKMRYEVYARYYQEIFNHLPESDKIRAQNEIVEKMPRRLRRSLGHRGYNYGLGAMASTLKEKK